ncbi:predicted protein [Botrytis cinerea T4]|uniref:Uncharacterized protein n=1 Tax=Botryotinia fuckeliana (strain T4) TaxID=999810 RepID=G2Y3Q6_BOTF4|nr:predicted protein [Botrytis cinerea T4]
MITVKDTLFKARCPGWDWDWDWDWGSCQMDIGRKSAGEREDVISCLFL